MRHALCTSLSKIDHQDFVYLLFTIDNIEIQLKKILSVTKADIISNIKLLFVIDNLSKLLTKVVASRIEDGVQEVLKW